MKKAVLPLLFCCFLIGATAQDCILPINDNSVTQIDIGVDLPGTNNLAVNPLQKVCFTVEHPWIGDLSVSLASPGGLHYLIMADNNNGPNGCGTNADNVEICIVLGNTNPLTPNIPYQCNGGPCSLGNCCLTGNWTVPCFGVTNPITGAQQIPNCDLNSFNVPGHPVNGNWTITVSDVCTQDVGMMYDISLHFANGTATCCGEVPAPTCAEAPLIQCFCLENGYTATTGGPNLTDVPPGFCGSIQNEQWISFQACWCAVNLTIQTGNGQNINGGVEAQLFTSCAPNFTPKTNCITVPPNSTGSFGSISCVPGNTYYLLVDGVDGDMIDYTVTAMPVLEPPVVITQDTIFGPTVVCEGDTVFYLAPPVLNAGHCGFEFSGDSTDLINPTHNGVTVVFGPESGNLCFVAENCTSVDSVCMFVHVNTISETVTNVLTACDDELPVDFNGISLAAAGTFAYDTLQTSLGCDSILQVKLIVEPCSSQCLQFNSPVAPSNSCSTAPPFCASYLNGFCSNNIGYGANAPGNLAATFGCSIENNQWLSFVPCEDSVAFTFNVSNCGDNQGMEFAVFSTTNCLIFNKLAGCQTVLPGAIGILQVPNLQPGNTYYLMVDGVDGDGCKWQIDGLFGVSGGTVLQEDITPGHIDGPTKICLDEPGGQSAPQTYVATAPDCKILPANPNNNTCVPAPDFCPPAPQKFSEPFMDTLIKAVAWDTIWHILPPSAGFFVNNDSIGATVNVVWDSVGHFQIDADLVASAWDTLIFLNDGIEECAIICPDNDPCDIPPLDVDVGAPDKTFEAYTICEGECAFAHSQIFCNPGQYLVTEIDSTGCTDSILITVMSLPSIIVNIFGPTIACNGESATLNASAVGGGSPFFYFWSNGQTTPSITVTAPGTYSVTVTNAFGCYNSDSHQFGWYPPIVTVFPPITICQESLPYNFFGTNVTTSGNYSAVLTNWQGCDSTINQQIIVSPPITVSITSSVGTSLPQGGSATLDAGAGFASYLWQTGENTQTITVDQPGTYTVTVTNSAGCTGTASITLVQVASACPNFNLPIAPSDSCSTAPPFCASYLNEYCTSNAGYTADVPGNLGSVVPCTIENNQWLSFVTCSDSAQLVLNVNSCAGATGLEFFVLQTTDCQIFTAKTACFEIADGVTDTLVLANLQSNETYYLMVDGIGGDVCNWQVLGTQGISDGATYQEDNTPGQVTGPNAVCAGGSATYTFTSPICDLLPLGGCPANQQFCLPQLDTCVTVQYDTVWHVTPAGTIYVNNDSMGLTVEINFPDTLPIQPSGSMDFVVSVEFVPVNVDTFTCTNDCISQCSTILPDTEPCAILPLTVKVCKPNPTQENAVICLGDCFDFYGETFCQPGVYTVSTTDQCNCVSDHTLFLDVVNENPPVIANLLETCNPTGTEYTVSFDVISFGGFVTVNGQPLNGVSFTSAPIQSGQPYSFLVAYFGQCNSYTEPVSGLVTCPPCVGQTYDLGTMALCPGECFDLQGNSYCAPGDFSETFLNPQSGCIDTYVFSLTQTVENQLVVGPATEFCDASNLYYSVGFSIMDGTPPFFVNGNQIPGNTYQSGLIPSGQAYAFSVTDGATCSPQAVDLNGVYSCACLNSPGSVNLSATLYQCESGMVTAEFNNDAVLAPGDIHVFILHSNSGSSLGTVIGMNTTGTFSFVPGLMDFGQTYFISPAVGPDLGGMVDMASSCFSFAPGQAVIFYPDPAVQILPSDTITCLVNSLTISSLASGGSGDFNYVWTGPQGYNSIVANPTVSNGGAYLLTLTDNLTGCQAQAAKAVASDIEPPIFTVTNSEINCQQPNATLEAASQTPNVTFTWTFPTGDVMTGASISTNIPGDYSVVALGPNGCIADAVTFVADNGTPPSLQVTTDTINCSQPNVELVASSNEPTATFTWLLPDSTTFTGSLLQTAIVGSYSVVAASQNGCTTEAQTQVVQGPDPQLDTELEVKDPSCYGYMDGSIKVLGTTGGTAPYTYTLNDTLSGDFFQNLGAGIYSLETTDANGCTGEVQVQLVDPQEVMVSIGDDQFINLGESVTLTMQPSINPAEIIWTGPDGRTWENVSELTITPTENGRYTIIISDVNMCRSSDTTYVYVNGQGEAYLPNVFSPNADGQNDVYTIYAGGDVEQVVEMKIFDRWGGMKFVYYNFPPNDPAFGWDGKFKGKELDPGVFVVRAMVRFKDGTEKLFMSDLTLLR